jgi:hypothetical protein
LYRARPLLLGLACVSPLLLLGGVWWAVNVFVLTPGVPGDDASPEECVRFIAHERGLSRLNAERGDRFVQAQLQRLLRDAGVRTGFAAALRRLTLDEQVAFREHVFETLKPRVMADIRQFHTLRDEPLRQYLDERIVQYNRWGTLLQHARIDKSAFGDASPNSVQMSELLLSKTTEEERQLGAAYFAALAERVEQILSDPELHEAFAARIAAPGDP